MRGLTGFSWPRRAALTVFDRRDDNAEVVSRAAWTNTKGEP
jgi:hypothetical protein